MRNARKPALAAGSHDPDDVHARLVELSKCHSALDVEIGEWLVVADDIEIDRVFGYASIFEYGDRVFGWTGRTTFDRLRVARKLETLHATREALRQGEINWSIAREITRVAKTPDIEAEWLEDVKGKTVRQVEEMVAGRGPNESPRTPKERGEILRTVMLKMTADQYARYLLGVKEERELVGDPDMSEEAADVSRMERPAPGGDAGASAYQLAFVQKVGTDDVYVQTPAGPMMVTATVAETVACDATVVPPMVNGAIVEKASQTIPPAVRRQIQAESAGMCECPSCRKPGAALHHGKFRSDGGDHDPRFLANLCWYHHDRLHDGFLQLEGDRVSGWTWKHADGTPYGQPVMPALQGEIGDAYQGLRRLGYKDPDARRAARDAASAIEREGRKATGEAILVRVLRDAGREQTRTYVMKPSAHVGTPETAAASAHVGTAPTAHVGSDAAVIGDVASGLKNLGLNDGEARAKAVCEALRASGVAVTVEKALTEALKTRGAAMLAREPGGGGESMTGEAILEYGAKPTAHVGSDDLATLLPLFEEGELDDIRALERAWYREIQRELALAGL